MLIKSHKQKMIMKLLQIAVNANNCTFRDCFCANVECERTLSTKMTKFDWRYHKTVSTEIYVSRTLAVNLANTSNYNFIVCFVEIRE